MTARSRVPAEQPAKGTEASSGKGSSSRQRSPIPEAVAQIPRPDLGALSDQIVDEVQRRIVDYAPHSGDAYLTSTRLTITQAVRYFADYVWDPTTPRTELDESMRRLGRGEAYEGRSLEALRAAFQIGAEIARKHIASIAADEGVDVDVVNDIGDELVAFLDSLGEQAAVGFREAQAQLSDAAHQWRVRILDLILSGSSASAELSGLAGAGNWPVPRTVALLAIAPDPGVPMPSARLLHPRSLARLHADEPVVLFPAPVSRQLRKELVTLFAGHRLALGCDVPLADAASSLRWASRALDLAAAGVIPDEPLIDCTQHIGTLWIHSEPLLADIVNRTLLAPLYAEPPNSRRILGETLLMWIETTRASAPVLAQLLGKHPQTIRYRLKRLRAIFGEILDEPDRVMEMYYALRSSGPLWNGGRPAPPIPLGTPPISDRHMGDE